jgi:hypothetical protein
VNERAIALAGAVLLAVVHVFAGKLTFLEGVPRSRWLSAAGGISVAYVFVHLLPDLGEGAEHVARALPTASLTRTSTYVVALAGLALFYGLERYTRRDRAGGGIESGGEGEKGTASSTSRRAFWISTGAFAVYNVLVGHLLVRGEGGPRRWVVLYVVALALHFVVNDFGLREHHKQRYVRVGRWLLAAAVLTGAVVGLLVDVPRHVLALLAAFLAGGIVLNVLKEELPSDRRSRFWAFCVGAAGYASLLLVVEHVRGDVQPEPTAAHRLEPGARRR